MTALRRVLARLRIARATAPRSPAAAGLLLRFLRPAYDLRDWRLLAAARNLVRPPVPPAVRRERVRAGTGVGNGLRTVRAR